jgi:8-oxo-dGTP pyrophosphatase MutT (NUDIX family)
MQASGCIFLSLDTGRVMLQKRSAACTHPGTWGFFGGKSEDDERPVETLLREITEELGMTPDIQRIIPVNKFTSASGDFEYNSFVITVTHEFTPTLNNESDGFCWVNVGRWPHPLHRGARILCKSRQFIKKLKTIQEQSSYLDGYQFKNGNND